VDALAITADCVGDEVSGETPEIQRLLDFRKAAFQLAVRITRNRDDGEDAVQHAYLSVLGGIPPTLPPAELRTWFLRIVANKAKDHVRGEIRHRRRDQAVSRGSTTGPSRELIEVLQLAMEELADEYRVPVALCCEQGLTQREAAAVMGIPTPTLSRHVNEGLARLREVLKKAGYTTAPAAVMASLAQTAPPAPAGLMAALEKVVAGSQAPKAAGTAPGMSASAKGGLVVKIGLTVAAAGLVAGGAFWAVGGKSEEPAKPPAKVEKPRKFATPVTDPGAEWERDPEPFAGCWLVGNLDGPRRDMLGMDISIPRTVEDNATYRVREYDPVTERFFTAAGSTYGYLDGPLSRARFVFCGAGSFYGGGIAAANSPDGRYMYLIEPANNGILRRIDFEKKEVTTLLKDTKGAIGMDVDSKGNIYLVGWGGVTKMSPDGKTEPLNLQDYGKIFGHGFSMLVDDKNNRIYGSNRGNLAFAAEGDRRDWYVGYWDLNAGGKFVGVLPQPRKGEKVRKMCDSGPFEGTYLYCPGGLIFGPDDPDRRYLYYGGGDDSTFYRLDMEKKNWVVFGSPLPGKPISRQCRFGERKDLPGTVITTWARLPMFDAEGNMYFQEAGRNILTRYVRVK
jgi:RNA polymerase sigma-70 factor (ECF subfamily)